VAQIDIRPVKEYECMCMKMIYTIETRLIDKLEDYKIEKLLRSPRKVVTKGKGCLKLETLAVVTSA